MTTGAGRTAEAVGRVIHTGQVVVDLALRLDALPEPGGDVFAEDAGVHVGGGFNVLTAVRRVGAPAVYAGALGTGPFSDRARAELAVIGAEHTGPTLPEDLGYCVAITDDRAERTFISTRGAETRVPLDAFDAIDLRANDVLYISGYSFVHDENRLALSRLMERLVAAVSPTAPPAFRTVVDVSPMIATIPLEMLDQLAALRPLWSMNEREAAILAQRLDCDQRSGLAAALGARLGEVLLREGAAGAWWCDPSGAVHHIPTIVVDAIDSNGAGDAHAGVLCGLLARGETMERALARANIAGALSTTRTGPATCPSAEEIEQIAGR